MQIQRHVIPMQKYVSFAFDTLSSRLIKILNESISKKNQSKYLDIIEKAHAIGKHCEDRKTSITLLIVDDYLLVQVIY